jgi:molybdopterin molybdotransferase
MDSDMRPVADVRRRILDKLPLLESETVSHLEALGRFLAEPVVAEEDIPAFANSGMDGYAVRGADVAIPGVRLRVLADLPAGKVALQGVGAGEAMKIMTGAPLPEGADTVVRVEDTTSSDGVVEIRPAVATGTHVRPSGGDVGRGTTVIESGTRVSPVHVGVLATLGETTVTVARRPRVAVMSTGDELAPADTKDLERGMIRDSNRPMLMALVQEAGAEVIDLGSVGDDSRQLAAALEEASAKADLILTTGGVSMGDYDVVKALLTGSGVDFIKVAINPGKPLGFGLFEGRPFFGLPGNPVSVFVSFEQFARPALLTMQGAKTVLRPRVQGVAGEDFHTDPAKEAFVRVGVVDQSTWEVVSTGSQSSNVLSGAAAADCFAVVPVGVSTVSRGDPVTLELFKAAETRRVPV